MRRSSVQRRSVVEEILRAQARHRPWWWATPAMTLLLLAVFGTLRAGPGHATGPVPSRNATVTGYIQPCAALPFPLKTATGARLFSAAATVQALPGRVHSEAVGGGVSRIVFPPRVVTQERVAPNEKFRLDHLAPGRYVIRARYAGSDGFTYLDVSAVAGQTVSFVLPNVCALPSSAKLTAGPSCPR